MRIDAGGYANFSVAIAEIGKTVRWGGVRRDRVPAFHVFNMRDTAATDENGIIR
jgi:hypothetical protein